MKDQEKANKKTKQSWSTKAAMEQVYNMKLWGGNQSGFYSGEGSHLPELVNPYVDAVATFLSSFENLLVVCDLGCGDFNVGQELIAYSKKYNAVVIVPELIDYNKNMFNFENLEFHCLDISFDELPLGDCAIIKQVLQYLSNTEIVKILRKLTDFKYVILTEHVPEDPFTTNVIAKRGIACRFCCA